MNERLSEQQISNILPLLSAIAKQISGGTIADNGRLEILLPESVGNANALALRELELWADILRQVRTKKCSEASAIGILRGRGHQNDALPFTNVIPVYNVIVRDSFFGRYLFR